MIERDMRLRFEKLLDRILRYPQAVAILAHFQGQTESRFIADMLTATALGVIRDHAARKTMRAVEELSVALCAAAICDR